MIVAVLAVPIDLVFCVERETEFKSTARVRWLFGLVGRDLTSRGKKPEKKPKRRRSFKPFLAMLKSRGFARRLFKFVRDAMRRSRIRDLKVDLRVGLSDPAETGMMFAALGPASAYLASIPSADVHIRPDFEESSLKGQVRGDVRVFPILFVGPVLSFAVSFDTLRAIREMMAARRK